MPKELKLHPSQRFDVGDAKYGMRDFPVNSLKDLIHRTVSGDYRGGFVLEGFRAEINTTTPSNREVIIHNGIGVDRDGQLITLGEASDDFASNADLRKSIRLPAANGLNYIMLEFAVTDSDKDSRAFIDPTYQNTAVTDSGGDTAPAPRGKEFSLDVPTRQAHTWRLVSNTSGFSDVADPGSSNRTLRIPLCVVPVLAGVIDTASMSLERRRTTVIKKPAQDAVTIECADTRIFSNVSDFEIQDFETASTVKVTKSYITNDRNSNAISGFSNGGTDLADIEVGDRVVDTGASTNMLAEGSDHDCRPMIFALNDFESDQREFGTSPTAADEVNFRNNKYYSGRSLLNANNPPSADFSTTLYPDTNNVWDRRVKWPTGGRRSEHKLKTVEDQLMALATVVREMKYGEQTTRFIDGTTLGATTGGSTTTLIDTFQYFDTSMIGATLTINAPAASAGTYTVSGVTGLHTLTFTPAAPAAVVAVVGYTLDVRRLDADTSYVGAKNVGYLNEVYRARIDRTFNTYTNDLQERLSANKVPIVTVGDGLTTFGDYIGDSGLAQALADVAIAEQGGTIYVKSGTYNLAVATAIKSGTKIVGDGVGETTVSFDLPMIVNLSSGETVAQDIGFENISLVGNTTSTVGAVGRKNVITANVPIHSFYMKECHVHGGSVVSATDLVNEWAVQFNSSSSTATTTGITLLNNRFQFEGGGILFTGVRNVNVDGCLFQSETDAAAFVGMVEGMRFIDSTTTGAHYGGTAGIVPGQVRINNCMFEGQMTPDNNAPYRGWVYVASSWTGQSFKISNCDFVGDIFGDNTTASLNLRSRVQDGRCITTNANIDISVLSCKFHSYVAGVYTNASRLHINDSHFLHLEESVNIALSENWALLGTGHSLLGTPVQVTCLSSMFQGFYGEGVAEYSDDIGIKICNPGSASTVYKASILINGCSFIGLSQGIDGSDLATYAGSIPSPFMRYKNITVTDCDFSVIGNSSFNTGLSSGFSNPSSSDYTTASWVVSSIKYSGNNHTNIFDAAGYGVVKLSAEYVTITDNVFTDTSAAPGASFIIDVPGVGFGCNISGNEFNDCYVENAVIGMINLEIARSKSDIKINNNLIVRPSTQLITPTGVQNGVLVTSYRTNLTDLLMMSPSLEFCGNSFSLINGNYAFLAHQNGATDLDSEVWEWMTVTATGNSIKNVVADTTNFDGSQWDNNQVFDPGGLGDQDFLGGLVAQGAPGPSSPGYIGMLDFRRFFSGVSGGVSYGQATISDNTIVLGGAGVYDTTGNQGLNSNIGIRISKWPAQTNIHNNNVVGCQIVCKWTYQTPREVAAYQIGGASINMTGNSVYSENDGCAIEVHPATGFGDSGDTGPDDPDNYTTLSFHNNVVRSAQASLDGAYTAFYGVVRFWSLNNSLHTDTIDTLNLKYSWNITNNTLTNSVFYLDKVAAATFIQSLDTAVATLYAVVRLDQNTIAVPSSATNAGDICGFTVASTGAGLAYTTATAQLAVSNNITLTAGVANLIPAGTQN